MAAPSTLFFSSCGCSMVEQFRCQRGSPRAAFNGNQGTDGKFPDRGTDLKLFLCFLPQAQIIRVLSIFVGLFS